VSGEDCSLRHRITLQAIFPENTHPAWGTMPPTGTPEGQGTLDRENSSIARRQSESLPGYQLPAKSALLVAILFSNFELNARNEPEL
jgi:hypothetical protein